MELLWKRTVRFAQNYAETAFPQNFQTGKLGKITVFYTVMHCVKSVRIGNFSGPNAGKYGPEKF